MVKKTIKVVVVDDSAVVRQVLSQILDSQSDITVTATAADPLIAWSKMERDWPDVIITDIEMPRQNGLDFITRIMKEHPTPIIVCSAVAAQSTQMAMNAAQLGAVEVIGKPQVGVRDFLNESETMISDAVRSAAGANIAKITGLQAPAIIPTEKLSPDVMLGVNNGAQGRSSKGSGIPFVAIGASAGGTQAIEFILRSLPKEIAPIVIVQHMPEHFTKAFAERLNGICQPEVCEAQNDMMMSNGCVYIAPGGKHMLVGTGPSQRKLTVKDGPLVSRHRPSVDVLFRSVSNCGHTDILGIILTGMGDDGAIGMRDMHSNGIPTIAQSEESCVVFGMPKEAIRLGGVDRVIHLKDIASEIMSFSRRFL